MATFFTNPMRGLETARSSRISVSAGLLDELVGGEGGSGGMGAIAATCYRLDQILS